MREAIDFLRRLNRSLCDEGRAYMMESFSSELEVRIRWPVDFNYARHITDEELKNAPIDALVAIISEEANIRYQAAMDAKLNMEEV